MRGLHLSILLMLGSSAMAGAPNASDNRFLVFFDSGKAEISRDSANVLDQVVAAYRQAGAATVDLSSYSDRYGSAAENLRISAQRAQAVSSYLRERGIPATAVRSRALGERDLLVPTADGVMEAQNRRVELILGPGSQR